MTENTVALINASNRTSIKKLLKEANSAEVKAESYLEQASHKYDNVLVILSESLVPWKKITFYLQTEVFEKEWPIKESGRPAGYQSLLAEGFAPAIWVNRFNAYRQNKYSDYGVEKVSAPAPRLSDMTPDERLAHRLEVAKKNTERRITEPHVINRQLIRHNIFELYTFAIKTENEEAQKLLKKVFAAFHLDETGETIHELPETVEVDKNTIHHAPEPEEETPAA